MADPEPDSFDVFFSTSEATGFQTGYSIVYDDRSSALRSRALFVLIGNSDPGGNGVLGLDLVRVHHQE